MSTASRYQRVRLWSGIFSIGTHLALVWVAYVLALWMPESVYRLVPWVVWIAGFVGAFGVMGFFLDRLLGYEVETMRDGTTQSLSAWREDWLRGAVASAGIMTLGLILWVFLRAAVPFWLALAILLAVALFTLAVLPRWQLSRFSVDAPIPFKDEVHRLLESWRVRIDCIRVYDDGAATSLNGMFLPFSSRVAWITQATTALSPREIALLLYREHFFCAHHLRWAILSIVLAWITIGLSVAWIMPTTTPLQSALSLSAVMTTWCFLALFVWPPLNRRWMHAADRSLLEVTSSTEIAALLARVQEANNTDTALSGAKEYVFHPIPPLQRRLDELHEKDQKP